MTTKLVNYKLPLDMISEIENLGGNNKTALVIELLDQALKMRKIDDTTRHHMYEGAKKSPSFDDTNTGIRNLIDGLWI